MTMAKHRQRIDKVLSNLGFGSRKDIKKLVKDGLVTVNGQMVQDSGQHVLPEIDVIEVAGEKIRYREFIYLMMNKPSGVVSATEDERDEVVIDLLAEEDRVFNPFPVGRLDKDTEGLLLLTNDGMLAHRLLSPKHHVPKTYFAKVAGVVTEEDVRAFASGVTLDDGYRTMPGHLNVLKSGLMSEIELTIYEGKFHQVKRMFAAVGKRVVYLKRISMGPLSLDPELAVGEYRELSEDEVSLLKSRHGT